MNSSREQRRHPSVRDASLVLVLGVAAVHAAAAQNAPSSNAGNPAASADLQEVVVTATKEGAHPVDDVPMAIQAFTAESLVSKGVRQTLDLIELIPGASEQSGIGGVSNFLLQRIGRRRSRRRRHDRLLPRRHTLWCAEQPGSAAFAVFRPGACRGVARSSGHPLCGTLYGQGSMGGAIIFHTRNPDLEKFGIDSEIESRKTDEAGSANYSVAAGVSLPLVSGQLGVRLSGGYDYRAGYSDVYQGAPVGGYLRRQLVRLPRSRRAQSLGIDVLVEVHSRYRKQIELARRVRWVYDFALPPLVLHAFAFRTAKYLQDWIGIRPSNSVTVLDTHDGIGILDVGPDRSDEHAPGLIPTRELDQLLERIHLNSSGESRLATGACASNLDLYQVNCTFYYALGLIRLRNSHRAFGGRFTPGPAGDESLTLRRDRGAEFARLRISFRNLRYELSYSAAGSARSLVFESAARAADE